ncbi:MAG: 16S rRNA (adenine(1518)-N(6)/adenine(1519)-N(6))-dimethyltransferase RsmA [Acidimicrobiia bacterium]|nr:16S rRNA (adenine(1518)-N(6)/adenine(1519)-N(6))-dimethyltransferase RsmA [Acidimicrobiia bacterium]
MTGQGRAEIRALLAAHGLKPQRSLGQNFLADPNFVDRIVRIAAVGPGDHVVEVGAGTGTLTKALAATGAHVVAYEIDRGLMPLLEQVLAGTDVDLRGEDVTKVDLSAALGGGMWTMVANLPYNVGTPLVLDVLRHVPEITRLVVMVQKEVAERFVAGPGSRSYGVPSIVAALHSDTELASTVPPSVFYPMPEVDSAVIVMSRIGAPAGAERAIEIAGTAFQQRRKMLRRSLSAVVDDPTAVLAGVGIDPTARPEDLPPEAFLILAEAIA